MKNFKNIASVGLLSMILISQVWNVSAQDTDIFGGSTGTQVDGYFQSSDPFGGQPGLQVDGYFNDCCGTTRLDTSGGTVPVYGGSDQGNYLNVGYANNYDYGIGLGFGISSGSNYGYAPTIYNSRSSYGSTSYQPINWGTYGSGGSSAANSNASVNNSYNSNYYDNSLSSTYIDNSFCIGNNNCNTTHTNIVSNTTTVNGNGNSVNSSASGSTGSSTNCPTGYSANNGNCLQNPNSSSWSTGGGSSNGGGNGNLGGTNNVTQTIVNCNSGYFYNGSSCVQNIVQNPTPIYNPSPIAYNPSPIYNNTPVYNNNPIYNNTPVYNTPIYTPIYNYKTCQNGNTVYVGQSCYKTCSNGNTVIETQSCQKWCPNNVYVYEYQNCPVINVINYNYPAVRITANPMNVIAGGSTKLNWAASYATYCNASGDWSGSPTLIGERAVNNMTRSMNFTITCYNAAGQSSSDTVHVNVSGYVGLYNKVVTTIPTAISNNSAVCNGVAINNDRVANIGYFEVSELDYNGNIVKTINTNSANIGNANSNYYSAPVNGLKANTKYSCRAVVNNVRGVMKGEAIGFTTSGSYVNYVSTFVKSKTVNTKIVNNKTSKTKIVNTKTNIICTDNSGNKMTLDVNKKLIDVSINKMSQNIRAGEPSMYTISIKNKGGVDLDNVNIKLALDKSLSLINYTDWGANVENKQVVNNNTNNNLNAANENKDNNNYKINIDTLYKGSEKVYIVKYIADKKDIGASVVSTVYVSYDMNSNKGVMRDEVSAYTIDSIIESINLSDTNSNQNTVSKDSNGNSDTKNMGDKGNNTKDNNDSIKDSKTLGQWIDTLSFGEVLAIIGMLIIAGLLARNIYVLTKGKKNTVSH